MGYLGLTNASTPEAQGSSQTCSVNFVMAGNGEIYSVIYKISAVTTWHIKVSWTSS